MFFSPLSLINFTNCLGPNGERRSGDGESFAKLYKPVGKWGQHHTSSTGYLLKRSKLFKTTVNVLFVAKTGSDLG